MNNAILIEAAQRRGREMGVLANLTEVLDQVNEAHSSEYGAALAHTVVDNIIGKINTEISEQEFREIVGLRLSGLVLAGLIDKTVADDVLENQLDVASMLGCVHVSVFD